MGTPSHPPSPKDPIYRSTPRGNRKRPQKNTPCLIHGDALCARHAIFPRYLEGPRDEPKERIRRRLPRFSCVMDRYYFFSDRYDTEYVSEGLNGVRR